MVNPLCIRWHSAIAGSFHLSLSHFVWQWLGAAALIVIEYSWARQASRKTTDSLLACRCRCSRSYFGKGSWGLPSPLCWGHGSGAPIFRDPWVPTCRQNKGACRLQSHQVWHGNHLEYWTGFQAAAVELLSRYWRCVRSECFFSSWNVPLLSFFLYL